MKNFVVVFGICLFLFFKVNISVSANIDSVLKCVRPDTASLTYLDKIIEEESDEKVWFVYNSKMKEIAETIIRNSKDKKVILRAYVSLASAHNNIGYLHVLKGDSKRAILSFDSSLFYNEKSGNMENLSSVLNNLGAIYDNLGNIGKAVEYYQRSAKIREKTGDKDGLAQSYSNLGFLYDNQGDTSLALEYYCKSRDIYSARKNFKGMASALNNIGYVYYNHKNYNSALRIFYQSLNLMQQEKNMQGIAIAANNIGMILIEMDSIENAKIFLDQAANIYEKSGDKKGLAFCYRNIGNLYFIKGNIVKAKEFALKSYIISREIGFPSNIEKVANLLRRISEIEKDYSAAYRYQSEEIKMRDSILSKENFRKTQKQQARFEYEKKAATDSITHVNELLLKSLEMKKQRQKTLFAVIGLVLAVVAGIVIFRALRITKRQKGVILEKNIKLEQQKEEILSQRDEIASQNELLTSQKAQIEEIYCELTDSINYAKRIQHAVLPDMDKLIAVQNKLDASLLNNVGNIVHDYCILFKPKGVVSGDFYWATIVNDYFIFAVADCTGHGVPGAFMSMLGISFLNEIVRKKEVTNAGLVLDHLRDNVIEALKQNENSGGQKDGMDIVLCVLNTRTLIMQCAMANNPLYVLSEENDLKIFEPDKQPVGIYELIKPFTNHEIALKHGDAVFLASDGYEDQFGGPKNKKFMNKRLREILSMHHNSKLAQKFKYLNDEFENWKGDNEQTDDVTILGLKF